MSREATTVKGAARSRIPRGVMVGDYRVERVLGIGGMGTVYQAVNTVIDKRVALKVLHPELCSDANAVARFVQEARAVNRIAHRNIVDVFAFGTTHDGSAYLAMELLQGESLSQRIEHGIGLAEACHILVEITYALEAAHAAGIVHRDLKPHNVFLITQPIGFPAVKLLDFGIAKLSGDGTDPDALPKTVATTQTGVVIGTPRYIAPEQARCQPLDGRVDIYALGVVAFEMFTGRPPFVGEEGIDVVAKHLTMRPPAPSELAPSLPALADQIVGAMLAKDRELRPTLERVREAMLEIPHGPTRDDAAMLASSRAGTTRIIAAPVHARSRLAWVAGGVAAFAIPIVAVMMLHDPKTTTAAMPEQSSPPAASAPAAAPAPTPVPVEESPPAPFAGPPREAPAVAAQPVDEAPAAKDRRTPKRTTERRANVRRTPAAKPAEQPAAPPVTQPTTPARTAPTHQDALRDPFQK